LQRTETAVWEEGYFINGISLIASLLCHVLT
jgi:hypothetical protein